MWTKQHHILSMKGLQSLLQEGSHMANCVKAPRYFSHPTSPVFCIQGGDQQVLVSKRVDVLSSLTAALVAWQSTAGSKLEMLISNRKWQKSLRSEASLTQEICALPNQVTTNACLQKGLFSKNYLSSTIPLTCNR